MIAQPVPGTFQQVNQKSITLPGTRLYATFQGNVVSVQNNNNNNNNAQQQQRQQQQQQQQQAQHNCKLAQNECRKPKQQHDNLMFAKWPNGTHEHEDLSVCVCVRACVCVCV